VHVEHTTGVPDRGYLVWSSASAFDCGTSDTFRSYFSVPAALPTAIGSPAYEMTVYTSAAFTVPAGGGTFTLFLNSIMLSGASANDTDANDLVEIEFHEQ